MTFRNPSGIIPARLRKVSIDVSAAPGERLRQRCAKCNYIFRSTERMPRCPRKVCRGATEIIT